MDFVLASFLLSVPILGSQGNVLLTVLIAQLSMLMQICNCSTWVVGTEENSGSVQSVY